MEVPSNSDRPVSVGTVRPIALSAPLAGKSGSGVPVTFTGATSTGVPEWPPPPLLLLLELSEPPDATTATITATTTTAAIPPRTIHVRLRFGGGEGGGLRRVFVRELMRSP